MNLSRYSDNSEEDRLFYTLTPHLEELQQKVASTLQEYFPDANVRVLELGCGTGITAQHILTANPNLTLSAVDNESVSLEEAKVRLAQSIASGRLVLQNVDMYEYLQTQPDQSFDAVVSALALHNCDEAYRQKIYKEVFRVLEKRKVVYLSMLTNTLPTTKKTTRKLLIGSWPNLITLRK
jgi:tRNA (cmo5U34)-methyltransferase